MVGLMETLRARFGPLPVWIWLALITALGLTYYIITRRKNAAATSTADAAGAGQVPEVVSQDTINVSVPPEAPEPSAPGVQTPPPPVHQPPRGHTRKPADNERREKDNAADVREDRREPGEEPPEPATHHGQHRHHRPPKRHVPPRRLSAERAA